jgi:hypothetical protein
MRHFIRTAIFLAAVAPLVVGLGGCASTSTTETASVTYPDGRYLRYGDGTTTPYYWVWVPSGAVTTAAPPAPPPIPGRTATVVTAPAAPTTAVVVPPSTTSTVVVAPSTAPTAPTVVTAAGGRYQLYGDGATTPYYWVWVPSGTNPPPPPPVPTR